MTARRVRIVALAFLFLLLAVVFGPQVPAVRAWLLQRVQNALDVRGYALTYDASSGNAWSEIRLSGAGLSGPGVDVRVERMRVGYFLPSLLAGELPLSVELAGLRGDVDLGDLPSGGAGGGDPPITPVLEEVEIRDVALVVNNAPFTLPDLSLTDLELDQVDDRFAFEAEASTPEGLVRASGEVGLAPFALEAHVRHADLAIARHWWTGVTGGVATGTVTVDRDGVRADLQVEDGALAWLGLDAREVSGPIRYRHPVVEGDLSGATLDGMMRAEAEVDVAARRWRGTLTGYAGAPEVAAWVTRNMAFDSEVLALEGEATYALDAAGWTTVTLEGGATAEGRVRGLPFAGLEAQIRYASGDGVRVDATSDVARGSATASVASTPEGLRVRAGAAGLRVGPARVPTADLELTFTPDGPRGTGALSFDANVLDRPADGTVELVADPEGMQFFTEGSVGTGALTGAAVLDGSEFEGGLRVAGIDLPGVSGAPEIAVDWTGTLAALDVGVAMTAPEPLRPRWGGIELVADLRGRAAGTVTGLRTYDLQGAFGAVSLAASGDVSQGVVRASVADVEVSGRAETRASVPQATFSYGPSGSTLEGRVDHDVLSVSGLVLEPTSWTVRGDLGASPVLSAHAENGAAVVTWRPSGVTADLEGVRIGVGDRLPTLEGELSLVPAEGLASLRGHLTATLGNGVVRLDAQEDLRLDARLPEGFRAGPVALSSPLHLTGSIAADGRAIHLEGAAGDVRLEVDTDLGAEARTRVDVRSAGERLTVTVGGEDGLGVEGRLDLGSVANAFGSSAEGTVIADLTYRDGAYAGTAQVRTTAPVALEAELVGAGEAVRTTLRGTLAGVDVDLAGTLAPTLELEGSVGPLASVTVDRSALAGAGELPRAVLGPLEIPAQAWRLEGSLQRREAVLEIGASTVALDGTDGWRVTADVRQPVRLGARPADVVALASIGASDPRGDLQGYVRWAGSGAGGPAADAPAPEVRELPDPGAASVSDPLVAATFAGDLDAVGVEVAERAGVLASIVAEAELVRGDVRLSGTVVPETGEVRGAGVWGAGESTADLAFAWRPGTAPSASVESAAFTLAWRDGTVEFGGHGGDLTPFLDPALLEAAGIDALSASGRLETGAGGWEGSLDLDVGRPDTTARIAGAGERLLADVRLALPGGSLHASGALLPELELSVEGVTGPLALTGEVSGSATAPVLAAEVELEAVSAGPVALDPIRAAVTGPLAPLDLRLSGPGVDAAVRQAGPTGSVALTGTVSGSPQIVTVQLGGGLARPEVDAAFAGPVEGTVHAGVDGASGTLHVAPEAFPRAAPLAAPVRVDLAASADLTWHADLRAQLAFGPPLDVELSVAGGGLAYAGEGRVASSGGTLAAIELQGEGADAVVDLDVGALDADALASILPDVRDVRGAGGARLRTAPFEVDGAVELHGAVSGVPADVVLSVDPDGALDVTARVGALSLTASATSPDRVPFALRYDGAPHLALEGRAERRDAAGGGVAVRGEGTLASEPLSLEASWIPGDGLPAGAGDAARVAVAIRSAVADVELLASRPEATGEGWRTRLEVRSALGGEPFEAVLAGDVETGGAGGPTASLAGTLTLPDRSFVGDLDIAARPSEVLASLEAHGLVLRAEAGADDTEGVALRSATVAGTGSFDVAGVNASVSAPGGLRWTPEEGFAGKLETLVSVPALTERLPAPIEATAEGEGGLVLHVTAPENILSARIELGRTPWTDPTLAGWIRLGVPAAPLATWPSPAAATGGAPAGGLEPELPAVLGTLAVGGTLTAPVVEGPVELAAPIDVRGRLRYADGSARVAFEGDALDATVVAERDGWDAEAALDGVRLDVLPLADARLTGRVLAGGTWSRLDRATVNGLRIATRGGVVEAEGTFHDELAMSFRLDLPLEDVQIGPALIGRVQGPVVVRAPTLGAWRHAFVEGALDLDGAGIAGAPGRLEGRVGVRGAVPDVQVHARLAGTSGATGTLDVDADLGSGTVDAMSTLAYAGVETDLRIEASADRIAAVGTVRVAGAALRLEPSDAGISLSGTGALAGWSGSLSPAERAVELAGPVGAPLAAFAPPAVTGLAPAGMATLRVRAEPGLAAVLAVEDLEVSGRAWGDLRATFSGLDAPVRIEGEHIEATIVPNEDFAFQASLTDLPILADARVTASASGSREVLEVHGAVSGTYRDAPVALQAEVRIDPDAWLLETSGSLLAGSLDLSAARPSDAAWEGHLRLDGARVAGAEVSVEGSLGGTGVVPAVDARTHVAGPVEATGSVRASLEGVRVDQRVAMPSADAPLHVEGEAWPQIDLRVSPDRSASGESAPLHLAAEAWDAPLTSSGDVGIEIAGIGLRLLGGVEAGAALRVEVMPPLPGMAFVGAVASSGASPVRIVTDIRSEGLALDGRNRASGRIVLRMAPAVAVLHDVAYDHPSGAAITASGTLAAPDADVRGTVTIPESDMLGRFEGLPVEMPLPYTLAGEASTGYRVEVGLDRGTVAATLGVGERSFGLQTDLHIGGGRIEADLGLSATTGLTGEARLAGVTVPTMAGAGSLTLDGTLRGNRNEVDVALRASLDGTSAQISGVWSATDLLPLAWLPEGEGRRTLEVRLRAFDPTSLPFVGRRVPNLEIPLSGVLQIQPNRVFGRVLAPELRVLTEDLPLALDVTGSFSDLQVQGTLGRTTIQLNAKPDEVEGYLRLERFPAHLGIEALVGETDVTAEVSGVLRGIWPLGDGEAPEFRLATENVRLEHDDVVTIGNVTASYYEGVFAVDEARFEGVGTYEASGVIRQSELDFTLRADDADFGPLLGLVPSLARLSTDARGNLTVDARGTLADPHIVVEVAGLDVDIAGGSYRLPSAQATVSGPDLRLRGAVEGISPLEGRIAFDGGGPIGFTPFDLGRVQVAVTGRANVPLLGEVADVNGVVAFGAGREPTLDVAGAVGNLLSVRGTLAPLDLQIAGDDLAVTSPAFLLASSRLDVQARVTREPVGDDQMYLVRGEILADEARFALGIRERSDGRREPSPALQRVVFDDVRIQAPRQLQLTENFGTLEGRADLTLGGTAAEPYLTGRAEAVRGNVRFFGREFTLLSAEAVFERPRGIYPTVALRARTTADKSRVLAGNSDDVRFVSPREGNAFEIELSIAGELEPTPSEARAFRLQVEPELSSDARIEVRGESPFASGPRPLLDAELLAIITLGRLEINPNLSAEQGIATAVAGTALDTVVDYLVVSELQRSLSEALGVDVVEIRTSNLSEVLTGEGEDPFSVSLRLGGYLTDELFASYRIGRFDDASATLGLTNEVRFTYELGPVAFDLAGSVGFEATGGGAPVPGLSAAIRYEVTPLIDLETSLDLSSTSSRARFGVTFRW